MATSILPEATAPLDIDADLATLIKANLHLSNLLDLLEEKVEDQAETLLDAARHYVNQTFFVLNRLQGDDSYKHLEGASK